MTAPADIPALIAEGRRLIAENEGKHRYCTMDPGPHAALRMLPALLDVAEAGDAVSRSVTMAQEREAKSALDSALSKLREVRT